MATSTIQLPADFVSNILTAATALISNFSGYLTLIIGILLGMLVIGFLISFLK
jgi:hypothetical protein